MGIQFKIGKHKTKTFNDNEGFFCVQYWNTIIFKHKDNKIILNNGSYFTNTTKTRINQAFNSLGLPFNIYQKNYGWYIVNRLNQQVKEYYDNIELVY